MLPPGIKLGPYEVIAPLGAGGMGEVYRARDTRLHRDVALKVLPAAVADDAARAARFEQEARAIAALSHPNVLAVFDTGVAPMDDSIKRLYVVTELLEGQTLGERLASGALPVRKSIEFASQIARGLAAAHDKDIVHRDLKPDNVFLTTAGHVKILDFGLARTLARDTSETRSRITEAGTVLGTVGYMAPEQVRGQQVDARADLFALGVVLYEMLTGTRAFQRPTAAETMTAILHEDPPDLFATRADVNPALDRIVQHCLEKEPEDRFQTARDVAFALEALSGSGIGPSAGKGAVASRGGGRLARERIAWAMATLLLAAAVIWTRGSPALPGDGFSAPHYATLLLPEGVRLAGDHQAGRRFAMSPDGTRIAFVGSGGGGTMMWVRSLGESNSRVIEGSEGAAAPFWSPDSRILAFRQKDQLMKLDVGSGGRAVASGSMQGAGAWGKNPAGEDIILAARDADQSIRQLMRDGRAFTDLFQPASGRTEIYTYPTPLPDGRHFLFSYGRPNEPSSYGLYLGQIGSTEKTQLTAANINVDSINSQYASGYVLSASNAIVRARSLNLRARTLEREWTNIAGPVEGNARTSAAFSVSQNGVLAFQAATTSDGSRLTVVDRAGKPVRTLADLAQYANVELSPDGSRLAVSVPDAGAARDIWIVDVVRGIRTRATYDPSEERSAVWGPGGTSLVYTSKGLDLYSRPFGAGVETPFVKDGLSKDPRGFSPDGAFFAYRVTGPGTGNDIWIWRAAGGGRPTPFLATPFDENYAAFSPDGRWLAYVSDESGRPEVYVTSFPSGEGKWQISTDGASFPRWRDKGEIVYLAADNAMMAAKVSVADSSLRVSVLQRLFQTSAVAGPGSTFDVSPDGRYFVINSTVASNAPPSITILYNWPALLKKR